MRILRLSILILLTGAIGFYAWHLYGEETQKRQYQEELIELSKVKYGMFSVDEWKNLLTGILSKKVLEFKVEEVDNEGLVRRKVGEFLNDAIDIFEARFKKDNERKAFGFLTNAGADYLKVFDEVKKDIPTYTEEVMKLLEKPENQGELQGFLLEQLNTYVDETSARTSYALQDTIVAKYAQEDVIATKAFLMDAVERVEASQELGRRMLFSLIGLIIILVLLYPRPTTHEYLVFSIVATILLVLGILLPMIAIDARVDSMEFLLAGEPVGFNDQVLYYKSKSIMEMVELLFAQSKPELVGVGVLVLAFSVIFPLSKLAASVVYLYAQRLRKSKLLQFLVFKTGKWSMADVMVVTIMMTYLGFGSILGEQLKQLDSAPENVDIITTGNSSLQVGFYLFLGFVLLSLLISQRMQYGLKQAQPNLEPA